MQATPSGRGFCAISRAESIVENNMEVDDINMFIPSHTAVYGSFYIMVQDYYGKMYQNKSCINRYTSLQAHSKSAKLSGIDSRSRAQLCGGKLLVVMKEFVWEGLPPYLFLPPI